MLRRTLLQAGLLLPLLACGKNSSKTSNLPSSANILALGDSLTFGFGARAAESWPMQLAQITGFHVVNAGINGDTSKGALNRLPNLLANNKYDAILIGIGGNDMLRGVPISAIKSNITEIVKLALKHTSYVALLATPAPDPMRAAVGILKDAAMYQEIAANYPIVLISSVYADVLSESSLRSDAIHANAKGYAQIAAQIAKQLNKAGWIK